MIDEQIRKYVPFDWDEKSLDEIRGELKKNRGKDYCIFPTSQIMQLVAMNTACRLAMAKTGPNLKRDEGLLTFTSRLLLDGMKGAGFTSMEIAALGATIAGNELGMPHDDIKDAIEEGKGDIEEND